MRLLGSDGVLLSVRIARAFMLEPQLLVVDDAIAAFDVACRVSFDRRTFLEGGLFLLALSRLLVPMGGAC